ncbi:MAG: zinc ribbon domain-containing protein [Methanomicrobiales archaeon]|nr:zinc ribbon domain-containing protein [Methanomicrobiales archaeon]
MTNLQRFCTECGMELVPGSRFCGKCGHPVSGTAARGIQPAPAGVPATPPGGIPPGNEGIVGIVPFLEQGIISVIHYTLVVTSRRLIFCPWNPDTDNAMAEADDAVMDESCNFPETPDEIAHFRAKDWSGGPWERYRQVPADTIASGTPGTISIPLDQITGVLIVCETESSTQDSLQVDMKGKQHSFDLMYSQGRFLFSLLKPLLGERMEIEDHLHRRGKLDRLLTGQEYR